MLDIAPVKGTALEGDAVEGIGTHHIAVGKCLDVGVVTSEVELEIELNFSLSQDSSFSCCSYE